ncbi:MAG: SGNH/GDSL hydrolase family protein [Bacillota bacterium]
MATTSAIRRWAILTILVTGMLNALGVRAAEQVGEARKAYPPVPAAKDPQQLGLGIQQTMTLLATSTPEHRNKVRILFYGQSITEQDWWKRVAEDLRKRFPYADLEIENRAIGGFASQLLIRPAEHDLYPFYPDLLIFHVYGANQQYEEIIRNVRMRTTAEILMQKDHVTKWPQETPDEKADKGMWWDYMMNHVFLPEIAKKYGCGVCDVRSGWMDYLKTNKLEPKDLLRDGVHLNDQGCYLMAELIKQYLVYRPELPKDSWQGMMRTLEVGKDIAWKDGKLTVEFEGNRVDVLAGKLEGATATARVLIDGKKPSEFAGCYRITRPAPGPWSPLFVSRVDHEKPLVLEDWTLKITAVDSESKRWSFNVTGSVTGPDGSGSNEQVFVSKSGRVKIDPAAFFKAGNVPVGYECKWKVLPMFVDIYATPKVEEASREYATTLAQGLANGTHRLEIISANGKNVPIRAIRVYCPPVR